ncbi:hypothetical protein [Pseudomonas sp. P7779]|nr:hypothetical protein [Pseudomonas sp. P7779]
MAKPQRSLIYKDHDAAFATHPLSESSVLLIGKLMDRETPRT